MNNKVDKKYVHQVTVYMQDSFMLAMGVLCKQVCLHITIVGDLLLSAAEVWQ
jgi:hypothetical protein